MHKFKLNYIENKELVKLLDDYKLLLIKYANLLGYEDAYQDLVLEFIVLINKVYNKRLNNNFRWSLAKYINKSIFHSYIKLSKKHTKSSKSVPFCDLSLTQRQYIDFHSAYNESYDELFKIFLKNILTEKEYEIIKDVYIYQYSISYIADMKGLTRQAINQMKNNALKKLKKHYKAIAS